MKLSVTKTVGEVTITRTFDDPTVGIVMNLTGMREEHRASYVEAFSKSIRNMLLTLENPTGDENGKKE